MLSCGNIKDHFVRGSTNIAIMLVEMVDELFTKEPAIPSTIDVCESLAIVHSIGRPYCTRCSMHTNHESIYILRGTILIQCASVNDYNLFKTSLRRSWKVGNSIERSSLI